MNNIVIQRRARLQYEINRNKMDIDYSCFQKTRKEKIELKKAKKLYNKKLLKYGKECL